MRRAAKIDANQPEIVEYFRKAGAVVDIVSSLPGIGYDLICNFRDVIVLVEVKDGSKPPSERRLTDSEYAAWERHGSKFSVISSVDEAAGLLESMAEHGNVPRGT